MPRSASSDVLQQHTFYLIDVGPILPMSLPIFDPLSGFKTCTAPEISLDFETIKEGNWFFDKKVIKGGAVGPITLERGVTWQDSDFWRWILTAVTGDMDKISEGAPIPALSYGGPSYRRDMLLIHFFNRMFGDGALDYLTPTSTGQQVGKTEAGALIAAGVTFGSGMAAGLATAGLYASYAGLATAGLIENFEFAPRVPARAYFLHGCIPTRYKVGSDFDATGADVSLAELEMQVDMMELLAFGF